MKIMEETLKMVVIDSLRTRTQTFTQTIPEIKDGNRDILSAIRIMSFLSISDFDTTNKLAIFIKDSWTDLESTDEQINLIVEYAVDIRLNHRNNDILNNL